MNKQQQIIFSTVLAIIVCILTVKVFFFSRSKEVTKTLVTTENKEKKEVEIKFDNNPVIDVELPTEISFCGEMVPLHEPEVRERLDYEMQKNVYGHSRTFLMLKRANRWFPIIERLLKEENMPDDLKYISVIESSLSKTAYSRVGAAGFWQFMKGTAKEYGLRIVSNEIDERYNLEKETKAACKYFRKAKKEFGAWALAIASYNRGIGGIRSVWRKQKLKKGKHSYYDLYLNSETSRYLFRAIAMKIIMSNPKRYNFEIANHNKYHDEMLKTVEIDTTVNNLPNFSLSLGISFKNLKRYNPWIRGYKLTVDKTGKRHPKIYQIKIPIDTSFKNYDNKLKELKSLKTEN